MGSSTLLPRPAQTCLGGWYAAGLELTGARSPSDGSLSKTEALFKQKGL